MHIKIIIKKERNPESNNGENRKGFRISDIVEGGEEVHMVHKVSLYEAQKSKLFH